MVREVVLIMTLRPAPKPGWIYWKSFTPVELLLAVVALRKTTPPRIWLQCEIRGPTGHHEITPEPGADDMPWHPFREPSVIPVIEKQESGVPVASKEGEILLQVEIEIHPFVRIDQVIATVENTCRYH